MATRSKFHGLTWSKKDLAALRKVGHPLVISKIPHTVLGIDLGKHGDDKAICIRTGDRMDVTLYKELLQQAKSRVNKYHAKRTEFEGVFYDSVKEAKYMADLMWREKLGQVTNIEYHKLFRLVVDDKLICHYEADFVFDELVPVKGKLLGDPLGLEGRHKEQAFNLVRRVVDCKGMRKGVTWSMFQIKRKLMLTCHGLAVEVV